MSFFIKKFALSYVNNKGTDQSAHLHLRILIGTVDVRYNTSIIRLNNKFKFHVKPTGLICCLVGNPDSRFSNRGPHIYICFARAGKEYQSTLQSLQA